MSIARTNFDDQRGHLLLLVILPILLLLVAGGVFGWVWWSRSQGNTSELVVAPINKATPVASVEEKEICAQVVTPAVDPVTGQCREFATPCEVPKTFLVSMSCTPEKIGWKRYTPTNLVFGFDYPESWDFFVRQTSIGVMGSTNLITQVAFDDKETGKRNPFRELMGRVELSWLGSANYEEKTVDDFVSSYYQNASPKISSIKIGELNPTRVEHANCSANKGCIDYVFKHDKVFYVLRALSVGDKSEDEKIILTMLYSWKFLNR